METSDFKVAIDQLQIIAQIETTAYMCSEAVWWSCHRALVSDYLKIRGWNVQHIMAKNKTVVHPFTSPARIINGGLRYGDPALF